VNSLQVLANRWKSENLRAFPPYGHAIVRSTFLAAGIEPPKDLIRLYATVGGMEVPDNNLWRLWPLFEVEEQKSQANEFGVLFSDYLLECWNYRVKPNDTETSAVYVDYFDGRQSFLVARTLEQFFDQYVLDADKLLNAPN